MFFRSWEGGRGGEGGWRKKCFRERGKEREACKTLLEVNMEIKEGERENERPHPPAEFERHSPTFLKSMG